MISGYVWGTDSATGSGVSLTYSFGVVGTSVYRTGYATTDPNSLWTLSATAQNAVRSALASWTAVANVTCGEVTDTATSCGDLRFGGSDNPGTAYTIMLGSGVPDGGDVWFGDLFADPTQSWAPGSYAYLTAIHEIGHALGLKHPQEAAGDFPAAPASIDSQLFSVMSYRSYVGEPLDLGYWQDRFATTPMVDDIAAIQQLYGANTATNAGDTVYSWQPGQAIFETIWDGGGHDTISWANQTSDAVIDLQPGSYSDLGPAWTSGFLLEPRTLGIAYDCWIESAIGGAGNDRLIGNDLDNTLIGGAGNDTLEGGAGNNLLDGGAGIDTADFADPATSYNIVHTGADEVTVTGPQGTNTLRGIEKLEFGTQTLALNPTAATGTTVSTLYAVHDTASGSSLLQEATSYAGPVQNLQWQWIGSDDGEAIAGSSGNDFINSLGGMDAIDGGAGDDVLDGGTGSNFLTGGAGHDIFFLDGRSGEPVWSTVTDLQAGEMVTVWGWEAGTSTMTWDDMNGAGGYQGATAHIDLDGNGSIDASLTLSGTVPTALMTSTGSVGGGSYLALWLKG